MNSLAILFYIVAFVLFLAKAFGQTFGRLDLLALGLASLTLGLVFS